MVEFVSANPTGPLHVGHARQAALGDAICNLLETQGWQRRARVLLQRRRRADRDAGSTRCRRALDGLKPGDAGWPEAAYNGDYIADIAADFLAEEDGAGRRPRVHRLAATRRPRRASASSPVAYLRHEQDLDLQAFGVRFDNYYLESSLYTERPGRGDGRSAWSPPARPTRRAARSGCAPPTTATTRTA